MSGVEAPIAGANFDRVVRARLYEMFVETARPPAPADVARALEASESEVAEAFVRLADAHEIVLRQGTRTLLMAAPFSAIPTRFQVDARGQSYWANCIWDALGVPVALESDARITARCDDCDEVISLRTQGEKLRGAGVVHFAVPARRWWSDIAYT